MANKEKTHLLFDDELEFIEELKGCTLLTCATTTGSRRSAAVEVERVTWERSNGKRTLAVRLASPVELHDGQTIYQSKSDITFTFSEVHRILGLLLEARGARESGGACIPPRLRHYILDENEEPHTVLSFPV